MRWSENPASEQMLICIQACEACRRLWKAQRSSNTLININVSFRAARLWNTAADGRGCFFLAHLLIIFSALLWWRHLVLAGPDEQTDIALSIIRPARALQGTHTTGESACLVCVLLQTAR